MVAIPLMVLIKTIFVWEVSSCGQLPQYNAPQLTHSYNSHYWPWHAAIFDRIVDYNEAYRCGGTLIGDHWILTAAHCVFQNGESMEPSEILISLGKQNLTANESRSEQSFEVTEIIVHEKYVPTYLDNDIALVRLSHTATFNHFVQPICLWKSTEADLSHVIDKYGTVVGWGRTETYQLSDVIQEAHFKVVSHGQCLESNRDFYTAYLTERNFCAGIRNGTSVCEGDSGGSMVFEEDGSYYIRGIVSSSPSKTNHTTQKLDCDTMQYAIYTDVAMFLKWIDDNMKIDCQTTVQCDRDSDDESAEECEVYVNNQYSKLTCKVIFDEIPDPTIKSLKIEGYTEYFPDLSDAIIKFENLEALSLRNTHLKLVEKGQLTVFERIKFLDLSNNQITELGADFSGGELIYLSLHDSMITQLHADTFKELPNLTTLGLSNNNIKNLPQNLFHNNKKLRAIQLDSNILNELHVDLFKELNNLVYLGLQKNSLVSLPQGLFRFNNKLFRIELGENLLKTIPVDIFSELEDLIKLGLWKNQLETLPIFRNNKKLKNIEAHQNLLKEIHIDTFSGADNVTKLNLSDNKLESLPLGLFRNNKKLKKIHLSENLLKELHVDTFKEVINLKALYLDNNKLERLPPGLLRNNQKLEEIYLNENLLKELHADTFQKLDNLTSFYARDNKLEILPQGIFRDNRNLQTIHLEENLLKELYDDTFEELHTLRELYLSRNKLEILPSGLFRNNKKLKSIYLDGNLLKELYVDTFKELHDLEFLFLQNNKLENLPQDLFLRNQKMQKIELSTNLLNKLHNDTFEGLDGLTEIHLSHNKLETLPQGLFRNNRNLTHIFLLSNSIDRIESDFSHLSKLELLDVSDNDCIDMFFRAAYSQQLILADVIKKIRAEC